VACRRGGKGVKKKWKGSGTIKGFAYGGKENKSRSEVTKMELGKRHSNVSGWDKTKGNGIMNNSKKRRICLLNNVNAATG
jgi:hypothetical protein